MTINNKTEEVFQEIKRVTRQNSGVITTKQMEEIGLYRGSIKKYVDDGKLVKEGKGLYSLASDYSDEYVILQKRSEQLVFSYGTALYLWGMSDRVPHVIHVTVPQGFNSTRIKRHHEKTKFHYVQKNVWDLGITETETSFGNKVKLYDKERCICDLVLFKDKVDKQLYIQAIKEYFKGTYRIRKLLKYAKVFGIEEKIRDYIDILT